MKLEKPDSPEPAVTLKALRSQVAAAKAEANRTADAAREAKAQLKKSKKAFKQAKKAAKHARKNLKSLRATLAAATPVRKKAKRSQVKALMPRNPGVIATLPPDPVAGPADQPIVASIALADPLPPPAAEGPV